MTAGYPIVSTVVPVTVISVTVPSLITGNTKSTDASVDDSVDMLIKDTQLHRVVTGSSMRFFSPQFTYGDRMWSFGVGLFLIELEPDSLQLTAVYGLCQGAAVLLLGSLIGSWVDRTARLKAARVTLVCQNVFVILGALVVILLLAFRSQIAEIWDGWLTALCHALLILFAVLARLASVGNTISIERDWIIEICGRDSERLTKMTATLRRIDLLTNITAPVATGQVLGFGSIISGAIFIASWNFVSVFVEYVLIKKVYVSVPALAKKKYISGNEKDLATSDDIVVMENSRPRKALRSCCYTVFSSLITLARGWKVFMRYKVAYAGIALACLYMTVLGFDNITTGYSYSQGMSESVLGLIMGAGAIVGILGTFVFPLLKSRFGLVRTGLISMATETICLTMCIASIWSPGSPFDPFYLRTSEVTTRTTANETWQLTTQVYSVLSDDRPQEAEVYFWDEMMSVYSNTSGLLPAIEDNSTAVTPAEGGNSFISLTLMLTGIVTARFGLWISDLAITQQVLESVDERERGSFSGVQNSINMLMDLLKFAMVVAAPEPEFFGILVLISFAFILLANVFYAVYSRKVRHHILPFHSLLISKSSGRASKRMVATP
ncbi:solute carrier family 40 member 1-like [Liolophura sinensis]|uniref:solute carrier family 40 member 1-like n=1 Tax=Liolophura sinensis TaxID=3198878 RepID=UPI0031592F8B